MGIKRKYKKKTENQKLEHELDNAWRELIKQKAGWKCEYCGREDLQLNAHHLYTRGARSTRWDIDNGICLCVSHHTFSTKFSAHGTPFDFGEWYKNEYKGRYKSKSARLSCLNRLKLKKNDTSMLYYKKRSFHKSEKDQLLEVIKSEIKKLKK